ncbi:hypothetical protein BpHYR1_042243, partial [Brachionus plicatilis]
MAEELNELKKLELRVSQTDSINNNSHTGNHERKLLPPSGGSSSNNSTESSTETQNNYTPAFLGDLRYRSSQAANLSINEADLPMAVIPFLRGSALSTIKNMIMKNKNLKWGDIKAHFKNGSGCDEILVRFQNLCDKLQRTHEYDKVRLLIRAVPERIGEELMLRQKERLDEAFNVVKGMYSCMGNTSYNTDKVIMDRYVGNNKSKARAINFTITKTYGIRDDKVCYECNKRRHVKKTATLSIRTKVTKEITRKTVWQTLYQLVNHQQMRISVIWQLKGNYLPFVEFWVIDNQENDAQLGLERFNLTGAGVFPNQNLITFPSETIILNSDMNNDESSEGILTRSSTESIHDENIFEEELPLDKASNKFECKQVQKLVE